MQYILTTWVFIFLSHAVMLAQAQPNDETTKRAQEERARMEAEKRKRESDMNAKKEQQTKYGEGAAGAPGISHELFLPTSAEPSKLRAEKSMQIRFEEARNLYNKIYTDRRYAAFSTQEHVIFKSDNLEGLKVGETIVLPPQHDYIYFNYKLGTRIAKKNGKVGMYDFVGNEQIPFVYESLFCYASGQPDDYKNIYHPNSSEKKKISEYALARFVAKSASNKKFGVIDIFNRMVLPFVYDTIVAEDIPYPSSQFIKLYKDGKVSVTTLKNETLIPFELGFEEIEMLHNFYFKVTKNGKKGIFNPDSQLVIPTQYLELYPLHGQFMERNGYPKYIVAISHEKLEGEKGHKVGLVNIHNDTILPFEFILIEGVFVNHYPLKNEDNEKLQFFTACTLQQNCALFDESGKQISPFSNIKIKSIIPNGAKPLFFVGSPHTQSESEVDIFFSATGEMVEIKKNALLINTVNDLTGTGQAKKAISILSAIFRRDNDKLRQLTLIEKTYHELELKKQSHKISPEDDKAESEKINRALIELIEN